MAWADRWPASTPASAAGAGGLPTAPFSPLPALTDGPPVQHLPANRHGRDFVIGDLHGCMDAVIDSLSAVRFNVRQDRLFVCGDLVDRGDENEQVLSLIGEPWFFSVRGNHDQSAIDHYRALGAGLATTPQASEHGWLAPLMARSRHEAHGHLQRLASLPLAITIDGHHGRVGLVHADVPAGLCWSELLDRLARHDRGLAQHLLWARPDFQSAPSQRLSDVAQVFAGHTPLTRPFQHGKVAYIDGGGVYRLTRHRQGLARAQSRGAWNLLQFDTGLPPLHLRPRDYGLLRVFAPRT